MMDVTNPFELLFDVMPMVVGGLLRVVVGPSPLVEFVLLPLTILQ